MLCAELRDECTPFFHSFRLKEIQFRYRGFDDALRAGAGDSPSLVSFSSRRSGSVDKSDSQGFK